MGGGPRELRLGLAGRLRRLGAARDVGGRGLRIHGAGLRSRLGLRRRAARALTWTLAGAAARAHGRRRARGVVAASEDHQAGDDHQDHGGGRRDRAERSLPATPLRVALCLPAGSELRQVTVSGFGHPGDEPIGCPPSRRPGRRGCRSRSRAPVRYPNRRMAAVRIIAPATMTSPRPGAMTGMAARSGLVMRTRSARTRSAVPSDNHVRWIASGSYRSRPSAIACSVVAVPATATSVLASRIGRTVSTSASVSSMARVMARSSWGAGGSVVTNRSVRRTLPICVDTA